MPDPLSEQPDFVWAHDSYLKSDNEVKDLEIRVVDDRNGKVAHRETHKGVHYKDATALAEKVLADYLSRLQHDADTRSRRHVAVNPEWDF